MEVDVAHAMEADAAQAMDVDAAVGFSDAVLDEVQHFKTWAAEAHSLGFDDFYTKVLKYCDPVVIDSLSGEHIMDVRDSLEWQWGKLDDGVGAVLVQENEKERRSLKNSKYYLGAKLKGARRASDDRLAMEIEAKLMRVEERMVTIGCSEQQMRKV